MNSRNFHASDRIRVDLIEADVDMAFGLVDDAREEFLQGDADFARHALDEAERVLADIDTRLAQLEAQHSAPFALLVEELRKTVRTARHDCP